MRLLVLHPPQLSSIFQIPPATGHLSSIRLHLHHGLFPPPSSPEREPASTIPSSSSSSSLQLRPDQLLQFCDASFGALHLQSTVTFMAAVQDWAQHWALRWAPDNHRLIRAEHVTNGFQEIAERG
jgi:hypothetical protein